MKKPGREWLLLGRPGVMGVELIPKNQAKGGKPGHDLIPSRSREVWVRMNTVHRRSPYKD